MNTHHVTDQQVLDGVRVLDLGGIGPGPYAAMLLADQGAEVIRVHRPDSAVNEALRDSGEINPVLDRGKCSLAVDLKDPRGVEAVKRVVAGVDVVIEGFRPGVTERLGLGPEDLMGDRPSLVYARITGWGQTGPLSQAAGHDMNYVAQSGVLSRLGRAGQTPQFPANLLGDFGGGGMQLAFGITAALTRAVRTGQGSVVNASMLDGANHLWSMMYGFEAQGIWSAQRGTNLLDGGAPFYDVYSTSDGRFVSVGCIEKPFFDEFVTKMGIAESMPLPLNELNHRNPQFWPAIRTVFTQAVGRHSATEIAELFEGTDSCVTVVYETDAAETHPHNVERDVFYRDESGALQPAPVPRFILAGNADAEGLGTQDIDPAGNPARVRGGSEPYVQPGTAPTVGDSTQDVLSRAGLSADEIASLRDAGVIAG